MGWISQRHMQRGGSIGGRSGKHKGPLRKITRTLKHSTNMFEADFVEMECGHQGRGFGGIRARCRECGKGDPRYNAGDGTSVPSGSKNSPVSE